MDQRIFYSPDDTPAMQIAKQEMEKRGICFSDTPTKAVTHLLLPVPCRRDVSALLKKLSLDVTVLGGALGREELSGYHKTDLLTDEEYLWKNAMITAHCAMTVATSVLPVTFTDLPILIIGWGRIGKCLAKLLRGCDAMVTVAARNPKDRAALYALGFDAEDTDRLCPHGYRVIFNTVPAPVLSREQLSCCRDDCVKIELASSPGLEGDDVIEALGLPGKYAPETSGKLIARTILRLCAGKEHPI